MVTGKGKRSARQISSLAIPQAVAHFKAEARSPMMVVVVASLADPTSISVRLQPDLAGVSAKMLKGHSQPISSIPALGAPVHLL